MTTNTEPDLAAIVSAAGPQRNARFAWAAIAAFVFTTGGLLLWAWLFFFDRADLSYVTQPLGRGDTTVTVSATGNLRPTNEVTVGSELSGTILEVHVDTNTRVTEGQPLAKLDTVVLDQAIYSSRASLSSATARVAQAQATLVEAEATLARVRELREISGGQLPSQAQFDATVAAAKRADADLKVTEAAVGEAQARVLINESDVAKAIIKSPIEGIVLTRQIEPGQTVAASFTAPQLFVIAESLENMKLLVNVSESDIGRVKEGQSAIFTVDAWPGRTYTARVTKVAYGSTMHNNIVTYEAEMAVENNDLSLRPGMTATAEIEVASVENVFLVPTAALRFDPETAAEAMVTRSNPLTDETAPSLSRQTVGRSEKKGNQIWVLRDGEPIAMQVNTGITDGFQTEITGEDLTPGLPIILHLDRL